MSRWDVGFAALGIKARMLHWLHEGGICVRVRVGSAAEADDVALPIDRSPISES